MYSSPGERKHDIASEHLATHEAKPGLFMILVSKAPALVWDAQMTGTGKLGQLVPKQPWPYVNHYSFHILDPDWGHFTIKMSGHPPFGAQVMLNGHEYVARQARKTAIDFSKQDMLYYDPQRRRPGESRRYLVSGRDCRALAPALRALDLYHLPLFCSRSGRAKEKPVSLPVLRVSNRILSQPAVPVGSADGRDLPSAH